MKPHKLKKRRQFLAAAQAGNKQVSPAFVVQARSRTESDFHEDGLGLGFTASKKVGNAVERNRAKRRMRALTRDCLTPAQAEQTKDLVVIARKAVLKRKYAKLEREFSKATKALLAP